MARNQYLSTSLFTFVLLAIMYSFGTFGFLNLFGIRTIVQVFVFGLISSLFVVLQPRYNSKEILSIVIFPIFYAIGSLINGSYMTGPIEAAIMCFVIYAVYSASPRHIMAAAKALVIITGFLCVLAVIAYAYYKINLDQFAYANFDIYDSEVGQQKIYPRHFMDWISFTSGDGFEFQGESSPRVKGYSREPSSTVVHYLAPSVFAFFLGGRFIYLGIFILFVNVIAIASLTGQIVVALSLILFLVAKYFRNYVRPIVFVLSILSIVLLTQSALMVSVFEYVGERAVSYFGFDLITRKLGTGSGGSLLERQGGMIDGLSLALSSPLGYSFDIVGSGAGLFYVVSSYTGWLGLVIFGAFLFKFLNNAMKFLSYASLLATQYALSLLFAATLIAVFVSGYGWDRPPGVVMLLLYYRFIEIAVLRESTAKISAQPKC